MHGATIKIEEYNWYKKTNINKNYIKLKNKINQEKWPVSLYLQLITSESEVVRRIFRIIREANFHGFVTGKVT